MGEFEIDHLRITKVYESVKPTSGNGQLISHRLGAKTIELIHQNVSFDAVHDDLDTLVLHAELLEAVLGTPDPTRKAKEIDISVSKRLRKHLHDPRFKPLAERLEAIPEKHEQGRLISIDFRKEILDLARDLVSTEQASPPIEQEERGKGALTELFEDAKSEDTSIMVGCVVKDIDAMVRHVCFDG